ncbi:MAG: DUF5658 family protein [Gammaproteobacteria bacterium]|jgi:hypothetical protein
MSEGGFLPDRRQNTDRREETWRAFVYGNFRPRRRFGRREADDHLFLFDWYEPRVLYLALGVLLLSCVDALFTLNLLNHGAIEANIFMASALERGIDGFLASKIALTGIPLVFLVAVVRRKFFGACSVERLLQFFCAGYLLLICYEIYLFEFVFDLNIIFDA